MIVNEVLQWAVLLFLGVFVVGLTRQLAYFMLPSGQQRASRFGPPMNKVLPSELLGDSAAAVRQLIAESRTGWGAMIVVNEGCSACEPWYEILSRNELPGAAPVIALSPSSDPEYVSALQRFSAAVVSDPGGERLRSSLLTVTPFLMVIDKHLRVRHKQIAEDPLAGILDWLQTDQEIDSGAGRAVLRRPEDTPEPVLVMTSNNGRSTVGSAHE